MNGPEHFKEAEKSVKVAYDALMSPEAAADELPFEFINALNTQAQVHATLALAAAQAALATYNLPAAEASAWMDVIR